MCCMVYQARLFFACGISYGQVGESNDANEEEYREEDPAFSASKSTPIQVVLFCSNISCVKVPAVVFFCFLLFAVFLPH